MDALDHKVSTFRCASVLAVGGVDLGATAPGFTDGPVYLYLWLQIAQSRSNLHTLGPKVGVAYILGALRKRVSCLGSRRVRLMAA